VSRITEVLIYSVRVKFVGMPMCIIVISMTASGGSVAEWLACWTR